MSGETPAVREALPAYAPEAPETERVPPGYRRTEVGVIPEDWETAPISDIVQNIIDYRGRTPRKLGMAWGEGNIPALSARNVKMGFIDFEEETYFGSDALYKRWMTSGDSRKDDIVFTMEAPLGNVALIPDSRKYILSQRTILLQANPQVIESRYLAQVMRSTSFQDILSANATGSTATGIQRRKLETLAVPIPSLHEQRAIAAALSDVDALISSLDKLIAKKRAVKTAAMQQLLTGKQRLPGFSGEWETKRLGDVCQIISGGTPSTSVPVFWTGEIPWCTPTDITEDNSKYLSTTNRTISEDGLKYSSAMLLPRGALLLCTRATIGEIKIAAVPVCTNQGFKSLVCGPDASNEFLFYKLVTLKDRLRELGVGSTFLEVSRKDVAALEISLPKLEEQTAIATVLSDMDTEIEALEARREKTRQVKQGMMQELLTGRTRLV